jgi:hypothetical protein
MLLSIMRRRFAGLNKANPMPDSGRAFILGQNPRKWPDIFFAGGCAELLARGLLLITA